jgi:hypothetical protein
LRNHGYGAGVTLRVSDGGKASTGSDAGARMLIEPAIRIPACCLKPSPIRFQKGGLIPGLGNVLRIVETNLSLIKEAMIGFVGVLLFIRLS